MKTCAAENCRYPVWSNLFCKSHQWMRTDARYDRRTPYEKYKDSLNNSKPQKEESVIEKPEKQNQSKWEAGKKQWFADRRKEMNGFCDCGCGKRSSKDSNKYFIFSCCHVLPKKNFDSISLHPENCIELAFFGGCHTTLDDMGYEYCKQKKPILWDIIVRKFKILYPLIATNEHQFIPEILLAEIEKQKT